MIRRRLKTSQLKMERMKIGKLSKTEVVITYLDGIVEGSLVEEVRSRLKRIDIDAIEDSGYILELIEDNPYSVFPQVLQTERPDRVVATLLMEISFEALREAGIRLPRPIGSAVSIVGALVIGQAAVQAGIVGAPLVIVVSITGIASFMFSSYSLTGAIRLLRFPMMFLAVYGILLGIFFILIHLVRLQSFGIPYLSPISPFNFSGLKDVFIRAPWWNMTERPEDTGKRNPIRMRKFLRPHPPNRKN